MDVQPKRGWVRRAGRAAFSVLLPFGAMRRTVDLAKNEARRSQDNLEVIRRMAAEARASLKPSANGKSPATELSFEEAIASRSSHALSVDELQRFFLRRKRAAIAVGLLFGLMSMVVLINGAVAANGLQMIMACLSAAGSLPLFFLVALGAQHRIWQLRSRRLSRAEKGGLRDFISEEASWWRQALDPELGTTSKGRP